MNRIHHRLWKIAATLAIASAPALAAPIEKGPTTSDQALAMRFAEMAQRSLLKKTLGDADFQHAEIFLEAARRSDPNEVRYPRLQATALEALKDREGAIEAVAAVRKLRPDDRGADLQLIDLYAGRMETVDDRIAYYRTIIDRDGVPKEVRAAVAIRCAADLAEKGRKDQASAMVDQALGLDPLNLPGLRWRLGEAGPSATTPQRVSMMAAIARSSPGFYPDLLVEMARTLARQGLVNESLEWFEYATTALNAAHIPAPPGTAIDFASEMLLGDKTDKAREFLEEIAVAIREDATSRELLYLVQKRSDAKAADVTLQQARTILVNRLETVRGRLKIAGATTRPADDVSKTIPDLSRDNDALKADTDPLIKGAYLQAIADLAWFEVYFGDRPDESAKLIAQFSAIAPKDRDASRTDQFAARVMGWIFLRRGKMEEAQVKLSAAAEKDPLAALGLVKLEKDPAREKAGASALLARTVAGMDAAIIYDDLGELGVKVQPGPDSAAVRAALAAAPREWMSILKNPRRFYAVRPEPLKVIFNYAEPMLVKVTVQNTSEFDLTVGDQGVIRKTLMFDAEIGGVFGQTVVPAVAVEDIGQQLILHPRQSISMIVRLDQGNLAGFLMANPNIPVTVTGSMVSNPVEIGQGKPAEPGPAGYRIGFPRIMERSGLAINDDSVHRMIEQARAATGAQRMRLLETMAFLSAAMRNSKDAPEPLVKLSQSLAQEVDAARQDKDPGTRAYASFCYAISVGESGRGAVVQKMMLPGAPWQERLLGLAATIGLPADRQKIMDEEAAKDADPTVRKFALASLEAIKHPTTQPATQPSKTP